MYSLRFRVRLYAVMCSDCQYAWCYVVIATKPVHRLQIRPIVHNYGTPHHSLKLHPGPCSSMYMWPRTDTQTDRHTDARGQYTFRVVYDSREI